MRELARARKYTPAGFRKQVEAYFNNISRRVIATEQIPSGRYDEKGHPELEAVPIRNILGEPVSYLEYVVPPGITALQNYLGISRETWSNYAQEEGYRDTITRARARVRAYLEEQLVTRQKGSLQGIIFDLTNNHGYTNKSELELGSATRRSVAASTLTMEEKLQLIKEASGLLEPLGDGGEMDGKKQE